MRLYDSEMPRFGLIGCPISHSGSPALFASFCGGRFAYDLIETGSFQEAWNIFRTGYTAVNVTAPFKEAAAARADIHGPEVEATGAANILINTPRGVVARNSDYLGLVDLISSLEGIRTVAVIGLGGAGKAAVAAARALGLETAGYHHDGIAGGLGADLVIYTLPCFVDGADRLECRYLLEANYKNPCLKGHPGYISGLEWLNAQARRGFPIMLEAD